MRTRFNLTPGYKRYIEWTGCTHTHPRTLGIDDLDKMPASGAHWARKVDLEKDPALFDLLDRRIRRGRQMPGGHAFNRAVRILGLVRARRVQPRR